MVKKGKELLKKAAVVEKGPWSLIDQEILYITGYNFYDKGHYKEAAEIFTQLSLINPFEEKYWRGLASSLQMQKSYEKALHAWAVTALICDSDPLPHFHAAECLLSLNDKEEALKALKASEEKLKNSKPDDELRAKIELLKTIKTSNS